MRASTWGVALALALAACRGERLTAPPDDPMEAAARAVARERSAIRVRLPVTRLAERVRADEARAEIREGAERGCVAAAVRGDVDAIAWFLEAARVARAGGPAVAAETWVARDALRADAIIRVGVFAQRAYAVILTPRWSRHVDLGSAAPIRAACAALAAQGADASDAAYDRLAALVVRPLELPRAAGALVVSLDEDFRGLAADRLFSGHDVLAAP